MVKIKTPKINKKQSKILDAVAVVLVPFYGAYKLAKAAMAARKKK